jgi:hypothetical protein
MNRSTVKKASASIDTILLLVVAEPSTCSR